MRKSGIKPISDKQKIELALRAKIKRELIEEYGEHCMKCGGLPDWRGLAIHHKIPLSKGGKTEKPNLILLCGRCHSALHGIIEK